MNESEVDASEARGEEQPDAAFRDPLPDSPLPSLERWLAQARASSAVRIHDAMALATVDANGEPQVRMVLCRGIDVGAARFTFYTHRRSPKALAVERSGRASAVFHWEALGRQVRLGGRVERASDADSDAYFASRPRASQLGAWASEQSEPVASRAGLQARLESVARRFGGIEAGDPIPRPPEWGGYVLTADRIELWAEQPGRLHDRVVWTRVGTRRWRGERLQP